MYPHLINSFVYTKILNIGLNNHVVMLNILTTERQKREMMWSNEDEGGILVNGVSNADHPRLE